MKTSYTVEHNQGCTIIYGPIPVRDFANLAKIKDGVISSRLALVLGANTVMGTAESIQALEESITYRTLPSQVSDLIGIDASKAIETGNIGLSSNFMLYFLIGFNAINWHKKLQTTIAPEGEHHPLDPDDLSRCRRLLIEGTEITKLFPTVAKASPAWRAIVGRWDEICMTMDAEAPNWRTSSKAWRAPKTYALLKEAEAKESALSPKPKGHQE
jgi:hypothetical protein